MLNRISTRNKQIYVEYRGRTARLTEAEIDSTINQRIPLSMEVERKLGLRLDIPVFFHRNRDGTMAVATGKPPVLWPEDERLIREQERQEQERQEQERQRLHG